MEFQRKMNELYAFIERWGEEVRCALQLGEIPDEVIKSLISATPVPIKFGVDQVIEPGQYVTHDGHVGCRVLSQDPDSGLVVLELLDSDTDESKYQTMSPGIFRKFFQPIDLEQHLKFEFQNFYRIDGPVAEVEAIGRHTQAREESFSWSSVEVAHGQLGKKYTAVYDALLRNNPEELKSDYLEFLFHAFVLGAKLGFSPRNDFRALYVGVFALTDRSLEEALMTKQYYDEILVDSSHVEYYLYDPVVPLAAPSVYYVTVSTKEQVGKDGLTYQEGTYLPTHRVARKV